MEFWFLGLGSEAGPDWEKEKKVEGGKEAMGWVSYENMVMKVGQLDLRAARAAKMEHGM